MFGKAKEDISIDNMLDWNHFKDKTPDESIKQIYLFVVSNSKEVCGWYWVSIKSKRFMSLLVRTVSLVLLIVGTALPVLSSIEESAKNRLFYTQWGVVLLVIAGLITFSDRVFGWSSGWIRYISTVSQMVTLCQVFELEWASYISSKTSPMESSDVKVLFDLSVKLEAALAKLKEEETTKWVAEFNTSISLLESMIKSQHEDSNKRIEEMRTNISNQANTAKDDEKLKLPGSIEVSFDYQGVPKRFQIALDKEASDDFTGHTWAKIDVAPGQHHLSIVVASDPPQQIMRAVTVQPAKLTVVEIKL